LTVFVDQFYAEIEAAGGRRWDTSSLVTRLPRTSHPSPRS